MKSNWWYQASESEKLAQVQSGYDLGLTQTQIATNLRTHRHIIGFFARKHNLDFAANGHTETDRKNREIYYPETKMIDYWKEIDNSKVSFAFDIFQDSNNKWSMNFLDEPK